MKFYDKEIYNRNEKIKAVIVIIIPFLIGFIFGVVGEYNAVKDDIRRAKTLDELKNKYKVIDI